MSTERISGAATPSRADRFSAFTTAVVAHLPFGLDQVVAPSLVGFVLINAATFALDLGCLTGFHGGLGWPLPLAISLGYGIAFGINYVLNRVVNFRSHGVVAVELPVYAAVVLVNYLVLILGLGDALTQAGLDYRLARVAAGACEAVYMYCALRWLVFRRR